ncbi:MAG: sulfite exporter TauE/SafE family protein [Woeseiaceae bacterium]
MEFGLFDPWLVAIALSAISLGALIKGITGIGLPLLAVPAIASFTSVEEAVVLMIIPTFGSNLWLVGTHRRFANQLSAHWPFLVAGLAGGVIGTFLLIALDDRWLKLTLAVWLAIYLIQFAFGNFLQSLFQARGRLAVVIGVTAGTIQGATGVSAHIVAPYFHGRNLSPEAYAFMVAAAFLTFSVAQLSTAASTHLFTPERLLIGLIALVPALAFTRIGIRLASRISKAVFEKILLTSLVVMEIKLIADVI